MTLYGPRSLPACLALRTGCWKAGHGPSWGHMGCPCCLGLWVRRGTNLPPPCLPTPPAPAPLRFGTPPRLLSRHGTLGLQPCPCLSRENTKLLVSGRTCAPLAVIATTPEKAKQPRRRMPELAVPQLPRYQLRNSLARWTVTRDPLTEGHRHSCQKDGSDRSFLTARMEGASCLCHRSQDAWSWGRLQGAEGTLMGTASPGLGAQD